MMTLLLFQTSVNSTCTSNRHLPAVPASANVWWMCQGACWCVYIERILLSNCWNAPGHYEMPIQRNVYINPDLAPAAAKLAYRPKERQRRRQRRSAAGNGNNGVPRQQYSSGNNRHHVKTLLQMLSGTHWTWASNLSRILTSLKLQLVMIKKF